MGCARDIGEKRGLSPVSRTAEQPGQSLNVDLCFVPVNHEAAVKLPAVSGSSGRLVVERVNVEPLEATYPGQVFADERLDYVEAMTQFILASQAQANSDVVETDVQESNLQRQKQLLRREEEALRIARRQIREGRRQEDVAWRVLKIKRRAEQTARKAQSKTADKPAWGAKKAQDEQWAQLRQQRRVQLEQRRREDEQWRQQRLALGQRAIELPLNTDWITILVVTDNCTRQCLGLPLFTVGAKVTAEMVVDALQTLLPPELQFLITDRGTHFTANVFRQLAQDEHFIHVLIARHRPQSNGIAERFVRTFKEWLADKSWLSVEKLSQLVTEFIADYNDRPHQGLPLPGLSPNEFAKRAWLM
jgi:transposase InsO family protein